MKSHRFAIGGVVATAIICAALHAQDHRAPPPIDVRGAVDDLGLTDDQRAKVDPLVAEMDRQQRQARASFLEKVRPALTDEQYQRLADAITRDGHPPRPRRETGDDNGPPATTRPSDPLPPLADGERRVAVRLTGGHDTDARDRGRPVALVAAALGVPAEVFRETFTHVHPADPGRGPTEAEARANKRALLDGLSKYGVTNDRIDAVSNYYRYDRSRGETWRHRAAAASAIVRDGKVVRFEVTDAGAGYTTPPTVTVDGMPDVTATVTLAFGTDLPTNGSVKGIAIVPVRP